MSSANYRRILLKVSGEMLAGEQGYGIQPSILEGLASEIASVVALDIEVALFLQIEHDKRKVVIHAEADGRGVHHF